MPTAVTVEGSQMTAFMRHCERETGRIFADASAFHSFTVREYRTFWSLFLGWSGLAHEGSTAPVCVGDACEDAQFFPELRLSYADSLLRIDAELGAEHPALTARDDRGGVLRLTRTALRGRVERVASALAGLGVEPGDRVVAIARNDAAVVVAGLAVAAVGAAFSTTAIDMGAFSVLARFGPLSPSVLMCHLSELGPERPATLTRTLAEIVRGLPSLRAVIVLDDGPAPPDLRVPVYRLGAMLEAPPSGTAPTAWRRLPFNHPLFVLFSSGTTGPPKCIVHGAGGTLLEHVKEHRLHVDLRRTDKLFFQTSCSWMMWNWQLSALASGAEIGLYSGAVTDPGALWRVVSEEGVTVFGTSPAYLQMCQDAGYAPSRELPLHGLRAVLSTGSILDDHLFDWVRENVGDVPLQSISGGTDIIGCFVLGNPNLPVVRGESQAVSLGLDVQSWGDGGVATSEVGELVCRGPFPSRPLGFYGDADGARFHAAYFAQNPGVWTHGDRLRISPGGAARVLGRSDSVLNVSGVRVGPAEIYQILRALPEIRESLAVEQTIRGAVRSSRLVLLVVLGSGASLDGALRRRIRTELARCGSAAHVPELILSVSELPMTHSGKRSERAARDAVSGVAVANRDALRNPESLAEITRAIEGHDLEDARIAAPAEDALDREVTGAWERVLDASALSPDDDFFALGGSSLLALRLCNELRDRTGWEVPPSILFEAPTISRMTAAIRDGARRLLSPVVTLGRASRRRPLFIVHGLGGDVLELRSLGQYLGLNRPVFGLRACGLDPRAQAHRSVEAMASAYVGEVRRLEPRGPYLLAGYSFGGLVAYEMARLLLAAGERVAFLGLLDTNVHDGCLPLAERVVFRGLRQIHRATGRVRQHARWVDPLQPRDGRGTPILAHLADIAWGAFSVYRPRPSSARVTFFRASVRPLDYCYPVPTWERLVRGDVDLRDVPGDHFSMIREPHVGALARAMALCIDRSESGGAPLPGSEGEA